ncbi:MAG TPA: histidinol-phosphate transaminase [Bacillales bacterium]|nr:histidinol-phosphate transaminase [Bacillales bacterium]
MEAKQQLKNLSPYKPGKNVEDVKKELGLKRIVKLASNENPFGSSPQVSRAIEQELKGFHVYPDGYSAVLRKNTAEFLGISEDQLIFGAGSDEVIQMLCRTYLTPGSNTVMAEPTFSQYKHNAVIEGAEIREIPLKNGRHDLEKMAEAADEHTKIVWLCMVNNPSGEYIRHSELTSFLQKVPSSVLVVCDEAYYEYVVAEDYADTLSVIEQYPNLVITRTFSKAYGMASLRVGYGIAHPSVITALETVRPPFNTTRISQIAAAAALQDQNFIEKCRQVNRDGINAFYRFCDAFNLSYYPSQGNFILIDFARSGDEVFEYLLTNGYIVRTGTALGYPNAVRITVGNREQTEEIIQCLSNWLKKQA